MRHLAWTVLAAASLAALPAAAQIKIGITVSTTGPAASLGVPEKNTVPLMPAEIAGQKIEYIVLDDGADSTRAVANARKLIDENNVDVLIGSSTTPASLAMVDVAGEKKVPLISLAASEKIVAPVEGARRWVFKTPQNDSLMARGIAEHMAAHGIKTAGFIGFNDAYGDGWLAEAQKAFEAKNIKIVATERYARNDQSVTGQVLKVMAAKPDAVLIAGAGTPAALPQKVLKERGYAGAYYQTHGVANQDFIRVGARDVEGTILPAGPVLVPTQLPDGNPIKPVATQIRGRLRQDVRPGQLRDLWRAYVRRRHRARPSGPRGAQGGQAGHAGVPLSAPRRARKGARSRALERHRRYVAHRPQRARRPRPRHGHHQGRRLDPDQVGASPRLTGHRPWTRTSR